jgi:hypothetical protein
MMVKIESEPISDSVRELLAAFERLTGRDQRDFLTEISRRADDLDLPPLDEETLNRIAAEAFLEYDAREAADAPSRSE